MIFFNKKEKDTKVGSISVMLRNMFGPDIDPTLDHLFTQHFGQFPVIFAVLLLVETTIFSVFSKNAFLKPTPKCLETLLVNTNALTDFCCIYVFLLGGLLCPFFCFLLGMRRKYKTTKTNKN